MSIFFFTAAQMARHVKIEPVAIKSSRLELPTDYLLNTIKMEKYETLSLADETIRSVLKTFADGMQLRFVFRGEAQNEWSHLSV